MRYRRWVRTGLLIGFIVGALAPFRPAAGEIVSVVVEPVTPSETDAVVVKVAGSLPNACWSFNRLECGTLQGTELSIGVFVLYDESAYACAGVQVEYAVECALGTLTPGTYQVDITEHHISTSFPDPDLANIEFTVSQKPVPVRAITWGLLKRLFRGPAL
jgi:hypothetical protein